MKKALTTTVALIGFGVCSYGQGTLGADGSFTSPNPNEYGSFNLDNTANTTPSESAASGGLVWIGNTFGTAALLNQDVNIAVYNGSTLIVSLLEEPNDTGPGYGDGTAYGGGQFIDNSTTTYYDTAVAGGGTASLTLDFWTGNYTSYAAAVASGLSSVYGATTTFSQPLGNGGFPASSATDFTGMPAVVLLPVAPAPEPATLALATLGGLSLLALRRRKA
jgi:hypothetical protein